MRSTHHYLATYKFHHWEGKICEFLSVCAFPSVAFTECLSCYSMEAFIFNRLQINCQMLHGVVRTYAVLTVQNDGCTVVQIKQQHQYVLTLTTVL